LFVLSNGAEDVEVTYPYQYFTERGATVDFYCLGDSSIFIHDFTRPTYKVSCLTVLPTLSAYQVVVIPGGIPSSSAVRINTATINVVQQWANQSVPANSRRLLAVICSGVETLLESNIINSIQTEITPSMPLTGSPASTVPIANYLKSLGLDASKYGVNNTAVYDVNPSPPVDQGNASLLVLGKNPSALPDWVATISKAWKNVTELPVNASNCTHNVSISTTTFVPITSLTQLPNGNQGAGNDIVSGQIPCTSSTGRNFCQSYVNAAILVSHGSHDVQVKSIYKTLIQNGITPRFVCPDWIYQKGGVTYLHNDPPVNISCWVNCTAGVSAARSQEWDLLFVPGGLFSTHAVLRNDPASVSFVNYGGLVGLMDTAAGVFFVTEGEKAVPSTRFDDFDARVAGFTISTESMEFHESIAISGSSDKCKTCNIVGETQFLAQRRVLTDYSYTPADGPIIAIAAGAALLLVGFYSFLFRARS
jgi:putative intracellular protease/amidase